MSQQPDLPERSLRSETPARSGPAESCFPFPEGLDKARVGGNACPLSLYIGKSTVVGHTPIADKIGDDNRSAPGHTLQNDQIGSDPAQHVIPADNAPERSSPSEDSGQYSCMPLLNSS